MIHTLSEMLNWVPKDSSFPFIDLRQDREKWRPLVNMVMSVGVP